VEFDDENIYSLNANQIDSQNFLLNVLYKDPQNGKVNYLPGTSVADVNLLRLLNWDRLNVNNDSQQNSNGTLEMVCLILYKALR
jgi:cell surface protein SprA